MANTNDPTIALKRRRLFITLLAFAVMFVAAAGMGMIIRMVLQYEEVPVATRNIMPYQQITKDDVEMKKIQVQSIDVMLSSLSKDNQISFETTEIIGQYLDYPVFQGEFFYKNRFSKTENGRYIATLIGFEELRLIAVPTKFNAAVAGTVMPGDVIDIWTTIGSDTGAQAMPILRSVRVLALRYDKQSSFMANAVTNKDTTSDDKKEEGESGDTVSKGLGSDCVLLLALDEAQLQSIIPYLVGGNDDRLYMAAVPPSITSSTDDSQTTSPESNISEPDVQDEDAVLPPEDNGVIEPNQ